MAESVNIIVEPLGAGFRAFFGLRPGDWEYGKTQEEALGKLLISFGSGLGVNLKFREPEVQRGH